MLHQVPPYKGKKEYFKDVKYYEEYYFNDDTCPSDDVFFEYLRAMAFAHSYEVAKKGRPFMQDGEKHYCPWVIINKIMSFDDIKDIVGIRTYTSRDQNKIIDQGERLCGNRDCAYLQAKNSDYLKKNKYD